MTARFGFAVAIAAALQCTSAWAQTVHVNDDFESYADNAALYAKWAPAGTNEGILWSTTGGVPNANAFPSGGDGLDHIGGAVNTWTTPFGTLKPTATTNVVLEGDLFDNGSSSNKRVTIGLRQNSGANNLFEMGLWNTAGANYYAFRMVTFGATLPSPDGTTGWQRFTDVVDDAGAPYPTPAPHGNSNKGEGWHSYKAVFMQTQAVITLDLFRDGNINSTMVIPYTFATSGFEQLRVGGPSGNSSPGGGVVFDNIKLYEEPVATATNDADFDNDGDVDGADFLIWQKGLITDGSASNATGDANNDNNVTGADLAIWKSQFVQAASANVGAVPEPASLALGAIAMVAGLTAARRRK